jgi:hypothetical protein
MVNVTVVSKMQFDVEDPVELRYNIKKMMREEYSDPRGLRSLFGVLSG